MPGFVALVEDELLVHGASQGLGIVARTPGALDRIEAALAVQWQVEGSFGQPDIDAAVDIDRRMASGRLARQVHADRIEGTGPWDVDLRIDVPLAAHAAIEPRAAVAAFAADGRLELWVGTQDVFYQRDVVARRLALDEAKVVVHGQRVGGGFGGRTLCTVELEAAVLARAVRLPVKVQWTRAQEFRLGFHRPPSSHRIRARLKDGRIEQWWHGFASSHILFTNAALPPWLQRLTDLVGDDGVARGARLAGLHRPLARPGGRTECVRHRIGHRRMRPRGRRRCGGLPPRERRGPAPRARARPGRRGRRLGIYKAMSYAAVVAEVEVEPATGRIRVDRLVCAHDCGQVVNPDQVRAQCEGNLVWGLGMALVEQLPVAASQVSAAHFGDYPIPRIGEVPPIEVLLVDEGEPPTGAGETAIVAAAAAIANAVRAATGVRPQRLPIVLHGREMMPR
ncbi:molybdopterin cofactor-binding domain-containing protein [Piscinibacter sakaiensis]